MRRISKLIITMGLLVLFLLASINLSAAAVEPSSIESKLESNCTYTGDTFRDGIMDNYYKIILDSSIDAKVYKNVKILQCSAKAKYSEGKKTLELQIQELKDIVQY